MIEDAPVAVVQVIEAKNEAGENRGLDFDPAYQESQWHNEVFEVVCSNTKSWFFDNLVEEDQDLLNISWFLG